jgi:3-oxoacyl-[acyl-carrier-protein] synthase-1
MAEAIRAACGGLALPSEKVDFTYCDLNGQRYRNEEFTFAALRTQSCFAEITDNLTPADCWGDIGAASTPLFTALAIASGQRRYANGSRVLLWAGSDSGHRAAALLELPLGPSEN